MPFRRREKSRCTSGSAREGGLERERRSAAHDTRPRWGAVGIHGVHRFREWDALVASTGAELDGDEVRFVALDDGTLVVDDDEAADLAPLAEAIEQELAAAVPRPGCPRRTTRPGQRRRRRSSSSSSRASSKARSSS